MDIEKYKAGQQKWGTGGSYQQAIQATTAALQGLNGGSVTAAIAGAAAPYIAEIIGHHAGIDNNDEAKVAAHAVANAVLASLQGQSALAGAAGAATGELTGILAMQMYGKPVSELSETDKQTISAMATLAAGIAGGIAGDSTAAAVVGAQAGKTTVDNNNLGSAAGSGLGFWLGKTPDCDAACKADIAKGVAEGNLVVSAGVATVAGGAVIVGATPEITAAAKAALEGCAASPVICLNNAGLQVAEAVTPGGIGAAGAIGVGKTAAEAAAAKAGAVNVTKSGGLNVIKNTAETQASIENKLSNYLLAKEHPVGGSKADWFDSALGFNKANSSDLAKQIIFDPNKAIKTTETQFGTKYDQVIPITGANGRVISVKFGWIKNNDGVVRLVTAIPAKK
ncbi:VENN motif pre-toxin domain-containing protein [Enterobacteriaceae bacterium ESL0689]|nr:VENN motif pre-toxin domain-containing protein [Enterobacteriaceae bacterium ESL0689]